MPTTFLEYSTVDRCEVDKFAPDSFIYLAESRSNAEDIHSPTGVAQVVSVALGDHAKLCGKKEGHMYY
jgi:hypothetical protein